MQVDFKQLRKHSVRSTGSWLSNIRASSFLRSAALLSGGSAAGHLFTLAVSPLLTRVYRPEDFACLGLFTSYLSVATVGAAMQYEASIISAADSSEAAYLAMSAGCITIPASALAGLALWLLIHYSLLGFGILPGYVPIALSAVMCFVGYFSILRYWNLRNQQFRNVSRALVVQNAARAIFQTIAGILGVQDAGLIVGETLGRSVGMGHMFRSAWREIRAYTAEFRWSDCKRALLKNWKFPLLSFPSSLIDAICAGMALPLLVQEYGPQSGGEYALVWRVLAMPSVLIIQAVADTFHSAIAKCARETPAAVVAFFRRTCVGLLLAGFVPCAILMLWARPLFTLVFGAQWALSGTMAAIIAPWYLGQFVVNPLSRVVLVLKGQATKLIWDVLCLIAIPTVFYEAHLHRLNVLDAVRLLSIVSAALYLVYFLVLLCLLFSHHRALDSGAIERLAYQEEAD